MGGAGPGSVVCLEAGEYDVSSQVWLSKSGTQSAPITYQSYGGRALIKYTGTASSGGGLLQTNSCTPWCGSHDLVIDGLSIDAGTILGAGIKAAQGSYRITVENCLIQNAGETGIALNAVDYVTAVHNQIYHNGYGQGWSSGISLWYGGNGGYAYGSGTGSQYQAGYDAYSGFHNIIADNIISGQYDNSTNHSDGNGIIIDGSGAIPPPSSPTTSSTKTAAAGSKTTTTPATSGSSTTPPPKTAST
jgi:hypothetical protein